MTLPSRKSRPTTRPNTPGATSTDALLACRSYRTVASSTARRGEPLWLPAGWLAVVLVLTASLPASGEETPGWRARGAAVQPTTAYRPATAPTNHGWADTGWASTSASSTRESGTIWQVDYEQDIAGPELRVANRRKPRNYRVAQQGEGIVRDLQEAIERPFGVDETPIGPLDVPDEADRNEADDLFDDLPDDPFEEEQEEMAREPIDRGGYQGDYEEEPAPIVPRVEPLPRPESSEPSNDARRSEARQQAAQECSESLASLRAKRLDMIDLSIDVFGTEGEDYPYVCSVSEGALHTPRCWCEVTYHWKASGLCHKPLYFEEVHLERYGHSWGPYLQPLVSGAHFFGRLPVLPYCMGLKAPNECVYTLGHYRPGNCAPYLIDPIPFTWRAALVQGAATVGVSAILP